MPIIVALVCDSLLFGGVETHLLSLLRYGDRTRYHWLVIAPTSPTFQAQADVIGVQVIPWQATCQLDISALASLVFLLHSHHVGLVHAHSPRAALFGRIAARLLGLPVVVTVHLPPYEYVYAPGFRARCRHRVYRFIEQVLNHKLTDGLIYVSSRIAQDAVACGIAPRWRTIVIENGIDLSLFANRQPRHSTREELGVSPTTVVLCFVGRFTKQKGADILLEAFYMLAPQERDWRLLLVGDGPQRAALETRARQLGVEAKVQFLGFRKDVPDLLMASDIFVLPSRYEAMPIAILEAMAAGLPCVVTNVGDNALLVEDGVNGYVVPPEDARALASALYDLIRSPATRQAMGDAARRKAQRYGVEQMVERVLAVYEQVVSRALNRATT